MSLPSPNRLRFRVGALCAAALTVLGLFLVNASAQSSFGPSTLVPEPAFVLLLGAAAIGVLTWRHRTVSA